MYQPLPIKRIERPDWGLICDQLEAGLKPVHIASLKETRALNTWAIKNRGYPVRFVTIAPGVVQFQLELKRSQT